MIDTKSLQYRSPTVMQVKRLEEPSRDSPSNRHALFKPPQLLSWRDTPTSPLATQFVHSGTAAIVFTPTFIRPPDTAVCGPRYQEHHGSRVTCSYVPRYRVRLYLVLRTAVPERLWCCSKGCVDHRRVAGAVARRTPSWKVSISIFLLTCWFCFDRQRFGADIHLFFFRGCASESETPPQSPQLCKRVYCCKRCYPQGDETVPLILKLHEEHVCLIEAD